MSQAAPGISSRLLSPVTARHHQQKTSGRAWCPHACSQPRNICLESFSKSSQAAVNSTWNIFFLPLDNLKSGPKTLLKMCVYELETFSGATSIKCMVQRASLSGQIYENMAGGLHSCVLLPQIGKCYWRAISYYIWQRRWEILQGLERDKLDSYE